MKRLVVLVTALFIPLLVWAQNTQVEKPMTLIKAGRLFDPEAGTYTSNMEILITPQGAIAEVGLGLKYPANTIIYDLSAYTVLPGLIDAHAHTLLEDIVPQRDIRDTLANNSLRSDIYRSLLAVDFARSMLVNGITSLRDVGISGRYADVEVMRALTTTRFHGPRMQASGPSLSPPLGLFYGIASAEMINRDFRVVTGGPDEARQAVREHLARRVSLISVLADNRPNPTQMTYDELLAIVQESRGKAFVSARSTLNQSAMNAARARVHTIDHGIMVHDLYAEKDVMKPEDITLSDETLKEMAQAGVILVATDMSRDVMKAVMEKQRPYDPQNLAQVDKFTALMSDRVRRAFAFGVKIAMGSNYYFDLESEGFTRGAGSRHTLYSYVDAGLPNVEALRAATINGALAMGDPRMGRIRPTAYADLIAVEGDPLVNIRDLDKVRFVMQSGTVVLK